MKRLIAAVVYSSIIVLAPVHAGVVMNLISKDGAGNVTGQIVISADAGKVRMDQLEEATSILFLGDRMVVLDHKEEVYIVMDDAMVDKLGAAMEEMQAQLAAMPPEQRAMVEQMMQGGMMPGGPKPPAPRVESLGSDSWGDYSCQQYAIFEGDEKTGQFCAAAMKDIEGGDEVMTAVMGMIDYMQRIIDTMPEPLGSMIGDNPLGYMADIQGFPVHSLSYEGGKLIDESTLESVNKVAVDTSIFTPPKNYRKQDMTP